ncbi:MAG: hypothetical protein ACI4HI_00240 [Lachnospiraceae bacterium]
MKEIFEQYGGTIITVIAIFALIAIIRLVIGSDTSSVIYQGFHDMIQNFYSNAGGI